VAADREERIAIDPQDREVLRQTFVRKGWLAIGLPLGGTLLLLIVLVVFALDGGRAIVVGLAAVAAVTTVVSALSVRSLLRRAAKAATAVAGEQRQEAEETLGRFFAISLDMLCVAGFDGYFKLLNPAWEKTLGYRVDELCARPFLDFVHPDDRPTTTAEAQRLAGGSITLQFENRYRHADGSYRWLLWNSAADVEAQTIYAAATDITARKEAEREIEERNRALEASNHDLEAFSYSVSHDLRSPLRAIDGYARILEEDYGQAFDAEGQRLLGVVRSEARRMGLLIDDLLSFSRAGRHALAPAPVDLTRIAGQIVEAKQRKYPDVPIEFVAHEAPMASADHAAIRQVLFNLIANAIKYRKEGQAVSIEFGGSTEGEENVYWLRDRGIGFDMRYAQKIFGVFQRLHSDAEIEGTGVGLAIVQRVVERHGGRVWAESEPGAGASFHFSLPVAVPASAREDADA